MDYDEGDILKSIPPCAVSLLSAEVLTTLHAIAPTGGRLAASAAGTRKDGAAPSLPAPQLLLLAASCGEATLHVCMLGLKPRWCAFDLGRDAFTPEITCMTSFADFVLVGCHDGTVLAVKLELSGDHRASSDKSDHVRLLTLSARAFPVFSSVRILGISVGEEPRTRKCLAWILGHKQQAASVAAAAISGLFEKDEAEEDLWDDVVPVTYWDLSGQTAVHMMKQVASDVDSIWNKLTHDSFSLGSDEVNIFCAGGAPTACVFSADFSTDTPSSLGELAAELAGSVATAAASAAKIVGRGFADLFPATMSAKIKQVGRQVVQAGTMYTKKESDIALTSQAQLLAKFKAEQNKGKRPTVCEFEFVDRSRTILHVAVSPCGKYVVASDNHSRVFLYDALDLVVLRVWKGYRQAQCAWVVSDDRPLILIYAPKRSQIEVYAVAYSPRLLKIKVGTSGRFVSLPTEYPSSRFEVAQWFVGDHTLRNAVMRETTGAAMDASMFEHISRTDEEGVDVPLFNVTSWIKSALPPAKVSG